jgi:hypothetical protein
VLPVQYSAKREMSEKDLKMNKVNEMSVYSVSVVVHVVIRELSVMHMHPFSP